MDPGAMAQHMKQRLRAGLKLTPEQMQQISPIIDHAASQLKTKREQTMRDIHEIFEQTHREMQPFLTPEQRHQTRGTGEATSPPLAPAWFHGARPTAAARGLNPGRQICRQTPTKPQKFVSDFSAINLSEYSGKTKLTYSSPSK